MSKQPKFSIITVATNQIHHTVRCIRSLYDHTKDFELIVVDNFSDDGTTGYLHNLPYDNVKVVRTNRKETFATANNIGYELVEGEYVVFLNNDTLVKPFWTERMVSHFDRVPFQPVGAVGPVSSSSNGIQMVGQQDSEAWYEEHRGHWKQVSTLYGWCIMVPKKVLEQVGKLPFDERFENSHEDNDLCLRILLAGYHLVVAVDTYIDHVGQGTLRPALTKEQYMEKGIENRERYCEKWYKPSFKKLVAVYRTGAGKHLEESLSQTLKFADKIILHFCRAPENFEVKNLLHVGHGGLEVYEPVLVDRTRYEQYLREKFPKICKIGWYDGIFQEDFERGWLLDEALKLHEAGEADWCISVDDDEIYEDKFIERVQDYMNPYDPEIFAYWTNWRTIWRQEMGKEYYRADSTFGAFQNYRFFRLIKGQKIWTDHPEGHHCGSAPRLADGNVKWLNVRVKHLGYDTPEQRQKKYEFYEANDHFKSIRDIGYDDYSHLVDRNVELEEYDPKNTVSFCMMVKNEEEYLLGCLENVMYLVDEYVIVDTGSTDKTREIIEKFSSYCPVPVRVVENPWSDNYSIPRNLAKSLCKGKWILYMDADERFSPENLCKIQRLTETDREAWIFHVYNYLQPKLTDKKLRYASSESCRLFRNTDDFYFTGVIHETVDDSVRSQRMKRRVRIERVPGFPLHHYGYLKKENCLKGKLEYYEELNKRQIELTEGKDARPYFNLALHYLNEDDRRKDALRMFQKALEVNPNFHLALTQMAGLNVEGAKSFLKSALKIMPKDHPFRPQAIKINAFLEENKFGHTKVV